MNNNTFNKIENYNSFPELSNDEVLYEYQKMIGVMKIAKDQNQKIPLSEIHRYKKLSRELDIRKINAQQIIPKKDYAQIKDKYPFINVDDAKLDEMSTTLITFSFPEGKERDKVKNYITSETDSNDAAKKRMQERIHKGNLTIYDGQNEINNPYAYDGYTHVKTSRENTDMKNTHSNEQEAIENNLKTTQSSEKNSDENLIENHDSEKKELRIAQQNIDRIDSHLREVNEKIDTTEEGYWKRRLLNRKQGLESRREISQSILDQEHINDSRIDEELSQERPDKKHVDDLEKINTGLEKVVEELNSQDEELAQELESELTHNNRAQVTEENEKKDTLSPMESWIERNQEKTADEDTEKKSEIEDSSLDDDLSNILENAVPVPEKAKNNSSNKLNILEQKLSEQEQQNPITKKLDMLGRHLSKLKEGKKGKTWYGTYVEWQNKGTKTTKFAKKLIIPGAAALLVSGGSLFAAGAGVVAAGARIAALAGAGAASKSIYENLSKNRVQNDIDSYKDLYKQGKNEYKSELADEGVRLSGQELIRMRELNRLYKKDAADKPQELLDLESRYSVYESQRKNKFSEAKTNYQELIHRRKLKNERVAAMVSAVPAAIYGGYNLSNFLTHLDFSDAPKTVEPTNISKIVPDVPENIPEKIKLSISRDAFINKGEGITHALKRQLESNPAIAEKLNYNGKVSDLARIAKEFGYIKDDGSDVRVLMGSGAAYELTLDEAGNPMVREHMNGHVEGSKYVDGTFTESHQKGSGFEGSGIEKKYEYINTAHTNIDADYRGVQINSYANIQSDSIDNQFTENLPRSQVFQKYPNTLGGTAMQVDGRFGPAFNNIITDRYTLELFHSKGITLDESMMTKLGYQPGENGKFTNINTGDKLYSWKDIYEQTDFDTLKLQRPDLFNISAGVNPNNIGIIENTIGGVNPNNTVVIENSPNIREAFTQTTGHFEVIHDEQGTISVVSNPDFKFTGEMETGDFNNRELRLIDKNKYTSLEAIPIRTDNNVPELQGTAIVRLKNGQYAFATNIGTLDQASGPTDAAKRLRVAMQKLGMENYSKHSSVIGQTENGTFVSRSFTPISEEQARYIGKIYSEINRFTGKNNPQ